MLKRKIILAAVGMWLLLSLACNYPGRNGSTAIPPEALRQTLSAGGGESESTAAAPGDGSIPTQWVNATPTNPLPGAKPVAPTSLPPQGPAGTTAYFAQAGDTLPSVAARFRVQPAQITSPDSIDPDNYLPVGQVLWIPIAFNYPDHALLVPDGEIVYGPGTVDFDIAEFIQQAGGFLSRYSEPVYEETLSGAQIIQRVAAESSVNPRLLLSFLEYRSGWVFGEPRQPGNQDFPLGFHVPGKSGLYNEMVMAATHMNIGYYGWRSGNMVTLKFADGSTASIDPRLNASSVGLQNLFAKFYNPSQWKQALYGDNPFTSQYSSQFGDPWQRAASLAMAFPPHSQQPEMELPFLPGERWSLTGGPHYSWNTGSTIGALDFSPVTGEAACSTSRAWVTASADGQITRSANDVVALDLDGDGNEQTGWVLIYLHLPDIDRIAAGTQVRTGDHLGHPSCERGSSTGTHVHLARKYNGEWLSIDSPVPFVLSGWTAVAGARNYQGYLVKGTQQVTANPGGASSSIIIR